MKLKNPLLVVSDIERSVEFYKEVLGLHKIMDFGANVTLTGGLCLQSLDSWTEFIDNKNTTFENNSFEIYFEEEDFDSFSEKIKKFDLKFVHPIKEHSWGQRVVRFYDPDMHIIEVGEDLKTVCKRFHAEGMTPEQVAERMDVPPEFVYSCIQ